MRRKLDLILGMLWASPITLPVFLLYILPLWVLRLYRYDGWDDVAWVWTFDVRAARKRGWLARFLERRWRRWNGGALGNIIILKNKPQRSSAGLRRTRIHEKEHVYQVMVLGIFQPVIYAINYIVGRWALDNTDGYYDNIFEIDARRKAGQLIDIIGAVNKIKAGSGREGDTGQDR